MSRHRHHKAFAWILGASLGAVAFAATPVQTAQAAETAEFAVAVVKVTVREANGRVYRAKTRAVRLGDDASFEVITDLHRHTLELSSREGSTKLRYSRDGGELASRTASFGRTTEELQADGHTITVQIVPTSVRVGTR